MRERRTTWPRWPCCDFTDDGCLGALWVGAHRFEGRVGRVGGDDGDALALVGDVERVEAEDFAGAANLFA